MPRAARSVGVLVAELDLVAMGLLDAHARPVGLHFLGHDHRQAGADAGAHLGAVRDDGDDAVGRDRDEHARIHHGAVRHLVGAGLVRGAGLGATSRGRRERSRRSAPRPFRMLRRETLSTLTYRSKPRSFLGLVDDVHGQTPVDARWTAFSMRW